MSDKYIISFQAVVKTRDKERTEKQRIKFFKSLFGGYRYKSFFTELKTSKLKIKKCPSQSKKPRNS